jgi:hypothetical protein
LEVFIFSPSDGCPATAPCLASTQAMRSRRVSPLRRFQTTSSHNGQTGAPHRSDRYPPVRPVRPIPTSWTGQTHRSDRSGAVAALSSVPRSWLCGSTNEPSGFLVNHWKPREIGVASANHHS